MENEKIIYELPERITSLNSETVGKMIAGAAVKKCVVLDAGKLVYIASAGLRMLLGLKKSGFDVSLKNVSGVPYETFRETGFTDIFDIGRSIRSIDLSGCKMIGRGAFSEVYRADNDTVVKVFGPDTRPDEIEDEIYRSKKAFKAGVATAISYDVVKVGEKFGTVYEMINADTLAGIIRAHPEREKELIGEYAGFMKKMHSISVDSSVFESSRNIFSRSLGELDGMCTPSQTEMIKRLIASIPERGTFIHGDFHVRNVMVNNGEMVLIDMGGASHGHPIFDIFGPCVFRVLSDVMPDEISLELAGIDNALGKRIWEGFLHEYFGTNDDNELQKLGNVCLCYSAMRAWLLSCRISAFPEKAKKYSMEMMTDLYASGYGDIDLLGI